MQALHISNYDDFLFQLQKFALSLLYGNEAQIFSFPVSDVCPLERPTSIPLLRNQSFIDCIGPRWCYYVEQNRSVKEISIDENFHSKQQMHSWKFNFFTKAYLQRKNILAFESLKKNIIQIPCNFVDQGLLLLCIKRPHSSRCSCCLKSLTNIKEMHYFALFLLVSAKGKGEINSRKKAECFYPQNLIRGNRFQH